MGGGVMRAIYRVTQNGRTRTVTTKELDRLCETSAIRFEGVDGDEEENTVTYWFTDEGVE